MSRTGTRGRVEHQAVPFQHRHVPRDSIRNQSIQVDMEGKHSGRNHDVEFRQNLVIPAPLEPLTGCHKNETGDIPNRTVRRV